MDCPPLTLYSKDGSYAQKYAKYNGIPFAAGSAPDALTSGIVIVEGVDGTVFGDGMTLDVKNAANDNALKLLGEDYVTCTVLDIALQQNGQEIQPGGAVKVILDVPDGYNGKSCRVFRMEADGSLTDMHAALIGNGTKLAFTTTHFSQYVIAQSERPLVTLGDVNGDGAIDTADAVLVLQRAAELIDDNALNAAAADVNGDGAIDTADAVLILQKAAELIERFPAE